MSSPESIVPVYSNMFVLCQENIKLWEYLSTQNMQLQISSWWFSKKRVLDRQVVFLDYTLQLLRRELDHLKSRIGQCKHLTGVQLTRVKLKFVHQSMEWSRYNATRCTRTQGCIHAVSKCYGERSGSRRIHRFGRTAHH
jgi:hypothetical protein